MHKAFVDAGAVFDREVSGKGASAGDWERIVLARTVDFPEGYEIPSDVNRNAVPWPDILADYSLMSTPGACHGGSVFPGENARQENVPERERGDGRRRGFPRG